LIRRLNRLTLVDSAPVRALQPCTRVLRWSACGSGAAGGAGGCQWKAAGRARGDRGWFVL